MGGRPDIRVCWMSVITALVNRRIGQRRDLVKFGRFLRHTIDGDDLWNVKFALPRQPEGFATPPQKSWLARLQSFGPALRKPRNRIRIPASRASGLLDTMASRLSPARKEVRTR